MEKAKKEGETEKGSGPRISEMKAVTKEAYGGGLYGTDDDDVVVEEKGQQKKQQQLQLQGINLNNNRKKKAPASDTQSADGPVEPLMQPKHKPPPSSGDRDIDITGQSYIQ